ncbi:MAG: type II toxin-antitoxin system RelE/ParE family toxin [Candidatus Aminicenantes bacterium]|jgi:toxin ParE1/3/4
MKNTYEIEFTHWAESDLDGIAVYIAENDDISKAVRVYLKLKKKILNLNESPYRGRIVPESKRIKVMDYREIIVNPSRIIYRVEDKTVTIFAVFDGRRHIDDIIYQRVTGL